MTYEELKFIWLTVLEEVSRREAKSKGLKLPPHMVETWRFKGCVCARDKTQMTSLLDHSLLSQSQAPALRQRPPSLSMASCLPKVPPPLCAFTSGTKVLTHELVGNTRPQTTLLFHLSSIPLQLHFTIRKS